MNSLTNISSDTGNALAQVQQVHEPVDLQDITFCTLGFWGFKVLLAAPDFKAQSSLL